MMNNTPWNFNNEIISPDEIQKIVYYDLGEIAMGAPTGGKCSLWNPSGQYNINLFCGGPAVWETNGILVAIPIWQDSLWRGRKQRIAILDTNRMEISIYSKTFNIIDFRSFHEGILYCYDSPIYKTKTIEFDIQKEKIKEVIRLA